MVLPRSRKDFLLRCENGDAPNIARGLVHGHTSHPVEVSFCNADGNYGTEVPTPDRELFLGPKAEC